MLTDTLNPIGSRFTVGRYLPHMEKTLGFKIEAAKLAKIDALAQTRGGRGPFMRQLVDAVLRQSGAAIEAAPVADREAAGEQRLSTRPTEPELAVNRHRAKANGRPTRRHTGCQSVCNSLCNKTIKK